MKRSMKYSEEPRTDAALIAAQCIRDGSSSGWRGSIEQQEAVAAILEPYGIRYTCDLSGTWRPRA